MSSKVPARATEAEHSDLLRALTALRRFLDQRLDQAIDEIAHYPTPIARCDVQLTKLLDERSELIIRLDTIRVMLDAFQSRESGAVSLLDDFLGGYPSPDEAAEARLVADIMVARGAPTSGLHGRASSPSDQAHRVAHRRAG